MGWKSTGRKVERKVFGKGGAKRRYGIGKGKGGFKFARLAADLEMVKSRLNVEKKYKDVDVSTTSVGQVATNADGIATFDLTPNISQGTDSDERVGNSLKLTGMSIPIQFAQQVNTLGDRKVRLTVLRVRAADNGVSTTEAHNLVWDINPLTGVRDFNAPRAYRSSKMDGVSIVRSMTCYVKGPHLETGDNGAITNREMNVKDLKMNLKLDDVLRFGASSDVTPEGLKYYLVIQCDCGNNAGSNSSLDVPITDNSSGLQVRIAQRNWWVDN